MIRQYRSFYTSGYVSQRFRLSLPKFPKNIFTKKAFEASQDEFFKPTKMPNPLFSMTTQEILDLNNKQYKKLVDLPMEDVEHSETFCLNLVSIIESNLLKNHQLIASLLEGVNPKIKTIVLASLKRIYFDNKIKLSFIELLDDPTKEFTHTIVNEIIESIVSSTNKDDESKVKMLLHYLQSLAYLNVTNPNSIIMKQTVYRQIFKMLPRPKYSEFYSYLFNINLKPELGVRKLQNTLSKGSELEKYVLRTGNLDSKWHDTVGVIDKALPKKMSYFLSFEMLEMFGYQAIKKNDLVDSNVYLDLIVSKFEAECKDIEESPFVIEDAKDIINKKVDKILRIVMYHLMTFKGVDSSTDILEYMVKNELKAKFPLLLTMMSKFRENGHLDEAIVLISSINLDTLTNGEKIKLANEVFCLTSAKYHKNPKILLGYAIKLFKLPNYPVEKLLKDLRLLNEPIELANIDSRLTDLPLTHDHLYEIYKCFLASKEHVSPEEILELFDLYCINLKATGAKTLKEDKISDKVLSLFLNYLLKKDPNTQEMRLIKHVQNYEVAKSITLRFYKEFQLNRNLIKPYPLELMIYTGVLLHHDLNLGIKLVKLSHRYKLPFTFNQVYPFIIYYYNNGDNERAQSWYKLLVGSGIKSKSSDMKEVYRIARELQWGFYGFDYRTNIIHKNYAKKEALENIDKDHLSFLKNKGTTELTGSLQDNLQMLLPHVDGGTGSKSTVKSDLTTDTIEKSNTAI